MERVQRFFENVWSGMGTAAMFCLLMAGIGGWIANIVKLFGAHSGGEIAVRLVGVFVAPIGAIAGWF